MKKRVSITDVARLASASISTVSRVINDTGYPVSAEVRERILAAVEQLHYTPSLAAQGLRNDFSQVIGLIVRDIADSYFGEIAKGATEKAMELGCLSFVCNTGRDPVNEMHFHELLWKNRVRGILLIGGGMDTPEYRTQLNRQLDRCRRFGLRIVANAPQGVDVPTVAIDLASASARITRHLLDRGHRTIGFITGDRWVLTSQEHLRGYSEALGNAGLAMDPGLAKTGAFTERSGYERCVGLLHGEPRPTAICCGSDTIAVGVLHALHDAGLRVPGDVSLISIGDTPMAGHLRPALTCLRVPRYRLGARAVELILSEGSAPLPSEFMPVELVERESVQPLS